MIGTLVGRTAEMAALGDVAGVAAATGRPAVGLVIGAAGLGKSRLLREIGDTVEADLRISLVGYEPEQSVPLAAARPLLSAVQRDRDELEGGPEPSWLEPIRLFEATHQAIRGAGRVLLTLDDLQWMDGTSVALCHYLLRAAEHESGTLTVMAGGRPTPTVADIAASFERRITDPSRFVQLELDPLEQAAGMELVHSLLPGVDPERAAELWAIAGGSPFWIATMARSGLDSIRGSTAARLRQLDPDAALVLALLAVSARPSSDRDLATQLDWAPDRLARAAGSLRAAGLISGGPLARQVAHDLIRAAVVRDIPDELRAELHRQVAASLEAQATEDVSLLWTALEHRRAAGDDPLALAARIARSPGRRWLGADRLRRLSAIADTADPLDPLAIELDRGIAEIAADLGEHATALDHFARASERYTERAAQAHTALGAARAAHALGLITETRAFLERARRVSDVPWVVIEAMAVEAQILLWSEHRTTDGLSIGRAAAGVARQAVAESEDTPAERTRLVHAYLGALEAAFDGALQAEDLTELDRIADEMIEVAPTAGTEAYLRALHYGGVATRHLGRFRDAARRYGEAWAGARKHTLPILAVESGTGALSALLRLGQVEEARALAAEVAALYDRLGRPTIHQVRPMRPIREVALLSGDWRVAVAELEQDLLDESDPHYRLSTYLLLSVWLSRVDRVAMADEVERHLAGGQRDAAAAGCPRCAAEFALRAAEASARIGRSEVGSGVPPVWRVTAAARPLEHAYLRWIAGLEGGSSDAALADLAETLTELTALGLRLEAVWLRMDLARAMEPRDRATAIEGYRTASRDAGAMGALTQQRLADQELRRLGARTWRRQGPAAKGIGTSPSGTPNADVSMLSDRELEIAGAVAAGHSNPEIAARLFLSRRTVEHHVSTILRKLDLRNRTELAAIDALRAMETRPQSLGD